MNTAQHGFVAAFNVMIGEIIHCTRSQLTRIDMPEKQFKRKPVVAVKPRVV